MHIIFIWNVGLWGGDHIYIYTHTYIFYRYIDEVYALDYLGPVRGLYGPYWEPGHSRANEPEHVPQPLGSPIA